MKKISIYRIIKALNNRNLLNYVSDKTIIKCIYRNEMNKKLNLKNPTTFNEKLQWLKLNDRNNIYIKLVDKYEVKKVVEELIGKEHIIPTLGVYDKFEEIDFEKLPNSFVIKCTHDSGGLVIVKNKDTLNKKEAQKKINKSLRRNYFYGGREWPYKKVKPRIIVEKYMSEDNNEELKDYKFFVFNGVVKCFKIDFNRFTKHQANYYDRDANLLKFGEALYPPDFDKKIEIPNNLNEMIKLAERLASTYPFVRVDFYDIGKKIYFGEMTFYPASGFGKFIPEEWDKKLGEWISLENLKKL